MCGYTHTPTPTQVVKCCAAFGVSVPGAEVRRQGGINGLWGATLKEVNDKLASFGSRLSLEELDADAGAPLSLQLHPFACRGASFVYAVLAAWENSHACMLVCPPVLPARIANPYCQPSAGAWAGGLQCAATSPPASICFVYP